MSLYRLEVHLPRRFHHSGDTIHAKPEAQTPGHFRMTFPSNCECDHKLYEWVYAFDFRWHNKGGECFPRGKIISGIGWPIILGEFDWRTHKWTWRGVRIWVWPWIWFELDDFNLDRIVESTVEWATNVTPIIPLQEEQPLIDHTPSSKLKAFLVISSISTWMKRKLFL